LKSNIKIVNNSGDLRDIPEKDLEFAQSRGYRVLTPEVEKELDTKKFGRDNPLLAGAAATARGVTLGLSDLALTKSGLVAPETLKALEEENPALSTGLEVASTIAPAFLTGGTGLAAKVLSKTPTMLATRAGEFVTKKVGAALVKDQAAKGVTKNVIKEITKKGAALGAGGAVEGSIVGVADLISENALENADFSAENLISSIGYGAALGGTIGFGIGATGTAIKQTYDKALNIVDNSVVKTQIKRLDVDDDVKKGLLAKLESDENLEVIKTQISKLKNKSNFVNDIENAELRGMVTQAMPSEGIMAEYAHDALMSGSSPIANTYRETVEKATDGIRKATVDIFEGKQVKNFSEIGDDIVNVSKARLAEKIKPMSDAYTAIDELVVGVPVTKKDITKVIKNFSEKDSYLNALGSDRKSILPFIDDFSKIENYSQAQRLKSALSTKARELKVKGEFAQAKIIKDLANSADDLRRVLIAKLPKDQSDIILPALKDLDKEYALANKDVGFLGELFGKKAGKGLSQAKASIEDATLNFADSSQVADKLLNNRNIGFLKELQRQSPELFELWKSLQLNRMYAKSLRGVSGLKDVTPQALLEIIKRDKLKYGDVVDLYFTPKQVKQVESYAKTLNKLGLNKNPSGTAKFYAFLEYVRSPLKAVISDKLIVAIARGDLSLTKLQAGKQAGAIEKLVDNDIKQTKKIKSASYNFVKSLEKGSSFVKSGLIRGSVDIIPYTKEELQKSEEVYRDLQSDPNKLIDSFMERNPELNESLPEVSSAATQVITRAVQYLQTKIPAQRTDFFLDEYNPSRSEIFKFAEYSEAVFDPDKVLERMKSGYVSPRQLEALEVVYPETVSKLRNSIIDILPKAKISEKGKNFISLVLGVQTKPSLESANMQVLQANFAGINAKENGAVQQQQQPKKVKLGNSISRQSASDTDLALYRRNLD